MWLTSSRGRCRWIRSSRSGSTATGGAGGPSCPPWRPSRFGGCLRASPPRSSAASGAGPQPTPRARTLVGTARLQLAAGGDRMGTVAPEFYDSDLLPTGPDQTPYWRLTGSGVTSVDTPAGPFLQVDPAVLQLLTDEAMHDIAHYLRPAHLQQLRRIIDDPESSGNDRFVALDLLKNVRISAGGVLPMCQDTGTAIVMGKKSERVLTGADDAEWISRGVYDAYTRLNLRYSQLAPLTTWEERNTGTNLPAQVEIYSVPGGDEPSYKLLFMAKG